ncbi:hypothetical protein MNV49_004422, partial [Pseudohyphozyma bogoriensis]
MALWSLLLVFQLFFNVFGQEHFCPSTTTKTDISGSSYCCANGAYYDATDMDNGIVCAFQSSDADHIYLFCYYTKPSNTPYTYTWPSSVDTLIMQLNGARGSNFFAQAGTGASLQVSIDSLDNYAFTKSGVNLQGSVFVGAYGGAAGQGFSAFGTSYSLTTAPTPGLTDPRLIVAGGGGAGGDDGTKGGDAGLPGGDAEDGANSVNSGKGATQTGPGTGGSANAVSWKGGDGVGSAGGKGNYFADSASGGGGGYWGGGGGGNSEAGISDWYGSSGGGGSSYIHPDITTLNADVSSNTAGVIIMY